MALIMSSQSSNSFEPSSSKTSCRKHDVFLSFSAEVHDNFLAHLYRALQQKSILTFKDNVELKPREIINDGLLEAIEESRIAVIVLSKNYANSSWCLRELVHILECTRTNGLVVYPVFYHVSPSDVRKQGGDFGEEFAKACSGKEEVEVNRLKDVLQEVGNLEGWSYPNAAFENEADLIDNVVQKIFNILNNIYGLVDKDLVGRTRPLVVQVIKLVDKGSTGFQVIEFLGMKGIGRTILVKALYSSIYLSFESCSFVQIGSGKEALQEQINSDILKGDKSVVGIATSGCNNFCYKSILLVSNDVREHNLEQVEDVVKKFQEFSLGSENLVTTRDRFELTVGNAHNVFSGQAFNRDEATQIFKLNSFLNKGETEGFQINERTRTHGYNGEERRDSFSEQVLVNRSPDKIVTRIKRKRADLSLTSGIYKFESPIPCLLPHSVGDSSTNEDDDFIVGIDTYFQQTQVSDSTVESGFWLTIKAKCRGDTIKFRLSSSSGIHELSQQVSQRLNLEIGTYKVKYQDGNDWILIACDEDLRDYISSSISRGEYELRMLVECR